MKWINKTKTAIAVVGTVGVVTAGSVTNVDFLSRTTEIGAPMTTQFEGMVLKNYTDSVGVETWCVGETQMGRLNSGYTKEYCKTLFNTRYSQYSAQLFSCYSDKAKRYVTPAMHATFTDVFYNTGAKCNTGMIRALDAGNPVKACNYIKRYKRAGGKDCSKRKNNCWGVYKRRLDMLPICLKEAEQIPIGGIGVNE